MMVGLSEIIAGLRTQGKEALKSPWSAEFPLPKCELNKAQGSMPSGCFKYKSRSSRLTTTRLRLRARSPLELMFIDIAQAVDWVLIMRHAGRRDSKLTKVMTSMLAAPVVVPFILEAGEKGFESVVSS
jgi:hypothetical protein